MACPRLLCSDYPYRRQIRRPPGYRPASFHGTACQAGRDKGSEDTDAGAYLKAAPGYVEAMYAGPKSALRSIHDALIDLGRSLGTDVKVCPGKTIVPLYRAHVFAEVKPSTRTRIDLGLALKKSRRKTAKRLISTGGIEKGNRITHRIPISSLDEIDSEVRRWLQLAYDLDGD